MTAAMLSLLAAYYACDHAAVTRVLSPAEAQRCGAIYREVKRGFARDEDARLIDGYRAFKNWERENPDMVAALRS